MAIVSAVVWFFGTAATAPMSFIPGSMSPTYKPGALVIDAPAHGSYHPGEVITFRHSALTTDVVTHRITDVTNTGLIHTKGDANRTPDVWDIRPAQVRGTVIAGLPFAGFVVVYLQQPAGIGSVVTALLGLILLWGLCFPAAGAAPGFLTAPEWCPEPVLDLTAVHSGVHSEVHPTARRARRPRSVPRPTTAPEATVAVAGK